MRISEIDIRNFFSHRDTKLQFENKPSIIKISGDNGSGKSIIMSAIIFSLLKSLNKQANIKDIVSWGEKSSTLKVKYCDNKNTAIIKRKIKKSVSTDFKYGKNNEIVKAKGSTEKDKNEEIENYFGVNNTFLHNQQFSSEMIDRFIWKTPTQRLKFIEKALNLDEQNKYYDIINKKYFALSNQIQIERVKLNSIKEEKQRTSDTVFKQYEDQINEYSNSYEELKNKNRKFVPEQEKIVEELIDKKTSINNEILDISNKIRDTKKSMEIVRNDLMNKETDIKYYKNLIDHNKGLLDKGICPTCNREFTEDDIHDYSSMLEDYNKQINKIKPKLDELNKKYTELQSFVNEKNDYVNSKYNEITEIDKKISSIENEVKKSLEMEDFYKKNIDSLYKKLNNSNKELGENFKNKLNEIKKVISDLEEKQNILNVWKKVFGPKSPIRTSIIENYIELLSDRTNYYISRLFDEEVDFKFEFDQDKGNLDYKIVFEGNDTSLANLSLGQIRMIELSVLFAFYEIMVVRNNNKLKIMLLDEAVYGLSQHYIEKYMDLLEEFKNTYGLQIFFISHEDIDDGYFDRIINVRSEDTKSIVY